MITMTDFPNEIGEAIRRSKDLAIKRMCETGVPVGIVAVRVDITLLTARGWQPTIEGEIVKISTGDDLPEPSRASHMSS
jgi:hypothetical protein